VPVPIELELEYPECEWPWLLLLEPELIPPHIFSTARFARPAAGANPLVILIAVWRKEGPELW
jgi:hypothetical protein